ncbi:MAG TPA: glycerol-3-phosphate responsive antiterminator [Clostridiales bacterium]|nr:glycerol-3-phosphate responsive antiterminator [Clostridiales bacterium]
MDSILYSLKKNPVIAAVRNDRQLYKAVHSEATVIFLLKTSLFEMEKSILFAKKMGKVCAVHFDFIDGLGSNNSAVDYLFLKHGADGIISTRSQPIRYAVSKGYCGIQRFFLIDSLSVDTAISVIESTKPTIVEIMPGIMHQVTGDFCNKVRTPVIAGGMINTVTDADTALKNGAYGISTSNEHLWTFKV